MAAVALRSAPPRTQTAATKTATASPAPAAPAAPLGASDTVYLGIVVGLESHAFAPGQRLVEADLATQFGVGRNSVREALQRLAAEGLVQLSRHKGAAIRTFSAQDTLDVLDVAERMTGLLLRAAVRGAGQATHRAAMHLVLQRLESAMAAQDDSGFATARRAFYRCLLDMGNHQELRRLFPSILMPIVHAQFRLPGLRQLRLADYRVMAAAVLEGRADRAEAAGVAHVRHVRTAIEKALSDGRKPAKAPRSPAPDRATTQAA